MAEILSIMGWVLLGLVIGAGTVAALILRRNAASLMAQATEMAQPAVGESTTLIATQMQSHFAPTPLSNITISERKFPFRVRADLQLAIDQLFSSGTTITHFCGIRKEYSHEGITFSDCVLASQHNPAVSVPPQYEDVNTGDEKPVRCLKNGLWFLEEGQTKYAVLLSPAGCFGQVTGMQFQIGVVNDQSGTQITQRFFKHLEDSVLKAESYRGKILSLEQSEH